MLWRIRHNLGTVAAILLIAALIGAGYSAFLDHFIRSDFSAYSLMRGALRGLILGSIVVAFEYSLSQSQLGEALRHAPFLISLGLRTLASTTVLTGAIVLSRLLLNSRGHSMVQWLEIGLLRDFAFIGFAAFLIHIALQTRRIVGGKTLMHFLLGRYNKPVVEERIFMLIDIVGSTAIARRLGDTRALKLISSFFFDIAEPISRFDGETDIYVGDEVVVSWPMEDRKKNSRCLLCYAAIRETMARIQQRYITEFGEAIEIRVGLHGGPIAVGECGDNKRQVVFIGDTVNTAKRLQEACRDYEQQILTSGALIKKIELPCGFKSELIISTILRGRDTETHIYKITINSRKVQHDLALQVRCLAS